MTGSLEGKVTIVTGGGSGIGRAVCRRFLQEGARVVVADRNRAGAQETRKIMEGTDKDSAVSVVDVAKPTRWSGWCRKRLLASGS